MCFELRTHQSIVLSPPHAKTCAFVVGSLLVCAHEFGAYVANRFSRDENRSLGASVICPCCVNAIR